MFNLTDVVSTINSILRLISNLNRDKHTHTRTDIKDRQTTGTEMT